MTVCKEEKNTAQLAIPFELEPAVRALGMLSPSGRSLVLTMLEQIAEREGITLAKGGSDLPSPQAGMELWEAKLRQESYSPETIRVYSLTVRRFLNEHPEPGRLDVMAWLAREQESKSTSAVATYQKALKSLFSFLYEEGLWPTDPTARMKTVKVSYRAKDPPTLEEVMLLLTYECRKAENTKKYRVLTLLSATGGLRVSEMASLRKDRIFLDRHQIRVIGKGDKERTVPLTAAAEIALRVYLEERTNGSPYVFPGDTKKGYMSIHGYEKTLRAACKKLGLKHFTPHGLRHFFATYTLQQGAKLEVVSHILGHASVGTTADIYRHVLTDEMQQTSRQFAPVLEDESHMLTEGEAIEGEFQEVER